MTCIKYIRCYFIELFRSTCSIYLSFLQMSEYIAILIVDNSIADVTVDMTFHIPELLNLIKKSSRYVSRNIFVALSYINNTYRVSR